MINDELLEEIIMKFLKMKKEVLDSGKPIKSVEQYLINQAVCEVARIEMDTDLEDDTKETGSARNVLTMMQGWMKGVNEKYLAPNDEAFYERTDFIHYLFLIFQIILMPNANAFKGFLLSCFLIGLFTSFHSATRTFVTPFLIGLSTITIIHEKNFIPR